MSTSNNPVRSRRNRGFALASSFGLVLVLTAGELRAAASDCQQEAVCQISASDGVALSTQVFRLGGAAGVIVFVVGGPGKDGLVQFAGRVEDELDAPLYQSFSKLVVVKARGVGSLTGATCEFVAVPEVVLATQYRGRCKTTRFVRSMTPRVLASDVNEVVAHLGISKATVVAQSWGAAVGTELLAASPPWLERVIFDSPAFVLSTPQSVKESTEVLRVRLSQTGLAVIRQSFNKKIPSSGLALQIDLLFVKALESEPLQRKVRELAASSDFASVQRLAESTFRRPAIPDASYIAYLCSGAVPQVTSKSVLLRAFEESQAKPTLCTPRPVPYSPIVLGAQTKVPVEVLCSEQDFRAPLVSCKRLAKSLGAFLKISSGTRHGLTTN